MIDGYFAQLHKRLWEGPARLLVRLGVSANQVTALGLVLVGASSLAYLWHLSALVFAATLAAAFMADSLDGAVARLSATESAVGGYSDAMADRYQETMVLTAIAAVSGHWLPAMLGLAGALITSYAKARAALEMPVANDGWPDLFESLERIVFLCAVLALDGIAAMALAAPGVVMFWGLWLYAALTNATALQRAFRARRMLARHDLARKHETGAKR